MTGGRPSVFRQEFHDIVMEVGKRGGSIAEMAVECGVSRSTFYEFIEHNPEFSDTVTHARELALVFWERLGRTAVEGKIPNFSANAFAFQMRNRFADYRDVQHVSTCVTGPPPKQLQLSELSIDQLESLALMIDVTPTKQDQKT